MAIDLDRIAQKPEVKALEIHTASSPPKIAGETFRLLFWNLRWFPGGKYSGATNKERQQHIREVERALQNHAPHVGVFCEVSDPVSLRKFDSYPLSGSSLFEERDSHGKVRSNQGLGFVSQLPVSKAEVIAFDGMASTSDRPPRGILYLQMSVEGLSQALHIFTVHFKSNLGHHPHNVLKRKRAMAYLLNEMDRRNLNSSKDFIVVAGDFNALEHPKGSETMNPVFEDTRHQLRNKGFEGSFPLKVDDLYLSKSLQQFEVKTSEVTVPHSISDHPLLIFELKR